MKKIWKKKKETTKGDLIPSAGWDKPPFTPQGCGAQVAQLVEHATENRSVTGSIPVLGTILKVSNFPISSKNNSSIKSATFSFIEKWPVAVFFVISTTEKINFLCRQTRSSFLKNVK